MSEIVIRITVPDGVHVRVEQDVTGAAEAIFADDLAPLPPEPGTFRGAAQHPSSDVCPVHRVAWKLVPAGTSKKSGRPYDAFRACPEQNCNERPR